MVSINDFNLVEIPTRLREPYLVVNRKFFRFNAQMIELLNFSEFGKLFIDVKNRRVAIQTCSVKTKGTFRLFYPYRDKDKFAKIKVIRLVEIIKKLIPGYDENYVYYFHPISIPDSDGYYFDLIEFDIKQPTESHINN